MKKIINKSIVEHQKLINEISKKIINDIEIASKNILKTLKNNKTIFFVIL